jgi:TolB-like protein
MAAIFLSYSREDRGLAEALTRLLEQAGHDVWWDRDIDSGSEFSGEIEAALERADVVLVAWSRASAKSPWVRDEAAIGRDSGRLVPVIIDGSQPPIGFRQFQALDLTGWKGAKKDPRSAALLATIDRRVKGTHKTPTAERAAVAKPVLTSQPRKRLWVLAALVLLMIGAGTAFLLFKGRGRDDRTTKPTIALVSFAAPSSDSELRDLSGQIRDALSHTLSQSGVPVRLSDSMPANGSGAGDFVISGEMGRNSDKVVATVRLTETTQGIAVFSKRYEASRENLADFPERIGAQMASMLSNGATLVILDRRHPIAPALLTELLAAEGGGDMLQHYQNAKRVAAKAPDVAAAQIGAAFFTGFVLEELPQAERPQALAEGRRAYERALELAPDFGDTHAAWCLLHSDSRKIDCEDQLRKGNRIDSDAPYLNGFLADLLADVGRFDEALEVSRLSYSHDPYDVLKISEMLRMLEASGDSDEARNLYHDGSRWWPEARPSFFRSRIFGLIDRGDFEGMRRVEHDVGVSALLPDYRPSTPIASAVKSKSIPALRAACAGNGFVLMIRCMIAFSTLGDLDSAYAIADKLYPVRVGRTPAETERIWLDDPGGAPPLAFITSRASAPMRRDPRYLPLAQRTGLLAYWRSGRLPDFCRKSPEPICSQLRVRH